MRIGKNNFERLWAPLTLRGFSIYLSIIHKLSLKKSYFNTRECMVLQFQLQEKYLGKSWFVVESVFTEELLRTIPVIRVFEIWSRSVVELRSVRNFV